MTQTCHASAVLDAPAEWTSEGQSLWLVVALEAVPS